MVSRKTAPHWNSCRRGEAEEIADTFPTCCCIHCLVERLLRPRWMVPQSPAPVCALAGSQQHGARQPLPHLPSLPQTASQRRGSSSGSISIFSPSAPPPLQATERPLGLAWGGGGEEEPQPGCRGRPRKPQPDLSQY